FHVTGVQTCALPILERPPIVARRPLEVARLEAEVAEQVPGLDHARILGRDRGELAPGPGAIARRDQGVGAHQPGVDADLVLGIEIGRASCRESVWSS